MNEALWAVIDRVGGEVNPALWQAFRAQFRAQMERRPEMVASVCADLRRAVQEGRL